MATEEQIIKEAEYYLNNNVTIQQASHDLNISKRTLQLHIKKLEEISPLTFKLVQEKIKLNIKEGNVKGGSTGKRGPSWTKEQATEIATKIIENEMTYQEAEDFFGIPSSTIHDMVKKGVFDQEKISLLYALSEANRRGVSISEFIEQHKKEHPISESIARDINTESLSRKNK